MYNNRTAFEKKTDKPETCSNSLDVTLKRTKFISNFVFAVGPPGWATQDNICIFITGKARYSKTLNLKTTWTGALRFSSNYTSYMQVNMSQLRVKTPQLNRATDKAAVYAFICKLVLDRRRRKGQLMLLIWADSRKVVHSTALQACVRS